MLDRLRCDGDRPDAAPAPAAEPTTGFLRVAKGKQSTSRPSDVVTGRFDSFWRWHPLDHRVEPGVGLIVLGPGVIASSAVTFFRA
jgi:hypothetical protein